MMTIDRAIELGWPLDEAPRFVNWYLNLNRLCLRETGSDLDDWPDWSFAEAYDEGMSVDEAFTVWMEDMVDRYLKD